MLPAAALLVLGLNAGLALMGLPLPLVSDRLPDLHAPLMVFGAVGTLISLERAVALRVWWAYAAPSLLAAGAIASLTGLPITVGHLLTVAGLAVHLLQYRAIWQRQPMTATAIQALGAASGLAASVAWSGGVTPARLVPLMAAFLVLTIAGERLELARITTPGIDAERLLYALSMALATAALLTVTTLFVAVPAAGLALVGVTAWLLRYDIARTTVHNTGLPRFVASCLLMGYAWLAVAGMGWIVTGPHTEGPIRDATTHAIFLGFVITMIMAHAPLILPAILGVRIRYHPALYLPVTGLQLALAVRVVAGDGWGSTLALHIGGVAAAASMILFGVIAVATSRHAAREQARRVNVTA